MDINIRNIYTDILELSDVKLQKDYWLGSNTRHISSYVEIMSRLFDDDNFDGFVDNLHFENVKYLEMHSDIVLLRDMLNNYQEKSTDFEIINDLEWIKITNQAKLVIEKWKKIESLSDNDN